MDGALLLAHVDDLVVTASGKHLERIQKEISSKFRTKWGEYVEEQWTRYLGLEWRRHDNDGYGAACFEVRPRPDYVDKLLEEYSLLKCRAVATPFSQTDGLHVPETPLRAEEHTRYRRAIGRLIFLLPCRPDLAFTVKELSRSAAKPTLKDEQRVKRCLRYLKGTRSLVLRFSFTPDKEEMQLMKTTVDASWAGTADRRSTTGYVLTRHGFPLLFASKTQTSTTLSSAESELVAIAAAATHAKLVVSMFEEIGEPVKVKIFSDSKAALQFMQRRGPGRIRHLDIRRMWLQEETHKGTIQLEHLRGENNPADLLTKSPPKQRFQKLRGMLGVTRPLDETDDAERECNMLSAGASEDREPRCRQCGEKLVCRRCTTGSRATSSWVNRPVEARQRAAALSGTGASGYGRLIQEGDAPDVQMLQRSRQTTPEQAGAEPNRRAFQGPPTRTQMQYVAEMLQRSGIPNEVQQSVLQQISSKQEADWVVYQCLQNNQ